MTLFVIATALSFLSLGVLAIATSPTASRADRPAPRDRPDRSMIMWTYFGLYEQAWWLILLAYVGTGFLPALVATLEIPWLIERLRGVSDERPA